MADFLRNDILFICYIQIQLRSLLRTYLLEINLSVTTGNNDRMVNDFDGARSFEVRTLDVRKAINKLTATQSEY